MSYFTSSKYERMMTRVPKPLQEGSKPAPPSAIPAMDANALVKAVCVPAIGMYAGEYLWRC